MKSPNQRDKLLVDDSAAGFVQTMYFDTEFNYLRGSVERISILPDTPDNWESEDCVLIPYVRYEYSRVSKKNLEIEESELARIIRAREKVKLFASDAKNRRQVLRVVQETIIINGEKTDVCKYNKLCHDGIISLCFLMPRQLARAGKLAG